MAVSTTPETYACSLVKPPTPVEVFWPELPLQLEPGEVVIEVQLERFAQLYDPTRTDVVIISSCGPEHRVYKIERVLAGDADGQEKVLVPNLSGWLDAPRHVLVGRLLPPVDRTGSSGVWPDVDPSLRIFELRLPPK